MNRQSVERKTTQRAGAEFLLFLIVSLIGVYSLGQGLSGLFEPGQGINLLWLAVTAVTIMILFAQMGRVHDTWPRKPEKQSGPRTNEQPAQQPPAPAEER